MKEGFALPLWRQAADFTSLPRRKKAPGNPLRCDVAVQALYVNPHFALVTNRIQSQVCRVRQIESQRAFLALIKQNRLAIWAVSKTQLTRLCGNIPTKDKPQYAARNNEFLSITVKAKTLAPCHL